jgi:hypothetical protein
VPPVPADVEIRVRFAPQSRATAILEERLVTRANRFGYVHTRPFRFDEPGEYRVDIFASHRDASGTYRAGTQAFASAVADRASGVIAHGMRGVDDQRENRQQWFSRTQIGIPPGRGHVPFAFVSGDVMWLQDGDAGIPFVTVQDVDGSLAPLRAAYKCVMPEPAFDNYAALGEIPLHSCGKYDPHIDSANVDVWAYSYRSVQRPHVRVREEIAEHNVPAPYWRFHDAYALQSGNGRDGDLPNDFKFQFGAAVLRGNSLPAPRYAIYGSLFVLVPDADPGGGTRTFPPFQGNGGGPSGGPLFTLKDKEIDLFFHPMGVRPGTILVVGEAASFAGYSAPPLASKVEIRVTSPSGKTRTIRGQANRIGWFYDPSQDFTISEAGRWRAKVTITFDGLTSAGPVSAPYPAGDVLGTHEGEFAFYVVDGPAEQLPLAPLPATVNPADTKVVFQMLPPAGLTNLEAHYTATMPGFVLEEGSGLTYTYDAQRLAVDFPNLDLRGDRRPGGVDIITISLFLSGTDAGGKRRHFARQVVLNGETLHAPEQKPLPKRRAVR